MLLSCFYLGMSDSIGQNPGAGLGCSTTDYSNYGFNSNNQAATIEYDNIISAFHTTIMRNHEGKFVIWGSNSNADGNQGQSLPVEINNINYPGLTGIPIKAAMASFIATTESNQQVVLTTEGLYVWGNVGVMLHSKLTQSNAFQKVVINGKSDGLPAGVSPVDVKMLVAAQGTLALVTCSGEAWVITNSSAYMRGDGSIDFGDTASKTTWSRVKKDASTNLDNVVAMRCSYNTLMALTSNNEIYTWGRRTLTGNEVTANQQKRAFATKMTIPGNGQVKMIGMTNYLFGGSNPVTYYVLNTDGKLYAMGGNDLKQLGDFTILSSPSSSSRQWVRPRYSPDNNNLMDNIKWFSSNESDRQYPTIHVINNDGRLWNWGSNSASMLGRTVVPQSNGAGQAFDPGQPIASEYFNPITDKVYTVEAGGHISVISLQCQGNLGFLGHNIEGSCSAGTLDEGNIPLVYITEASGQIDGVNSMPSISYIEEPLLSINGKVCSEQRIQLIGYPAGGYFTVEEGNGVVDSLNMLSFVEGQGVVKVRYHFSPNYCSESYVDKNIEYENCSPTHIHGRIWLDYNADVTLDTYESGTNGYKSGFGGFWVNLLDNNGLVVQSIKVESDGSFSLSVLNQGTYSILLSNMEVARGVRPPAHTLTLPEGWTFTGHSVPGQAPCVSPACITPGLITAITVNGVDLQDYLFGIKGAYRVKGAVFHDSDGLNGDIPDVDGNPINDQASDYVTQNNPALYVSAIDQFGKILHTLPVNADGTYDMMLPGKDVINLQLTMRKQFPGETALPPILPGKWAYCGESFGLGNGSGSGLNDGTGSGNNAIGTKYNGKIVVSFSGNNTLVEEVNFGIEQAPTAISRNFILQWNDFKDGAPTGFPTLQDYRYITMSSSLLIDPNNDLMGNIAGTDPEDCPDEGSCNGTDGNLSASFIIGSIQSGTRLFYDYGGTIGVVEILPNTTIVDFNIEKMVIYGKANESGDANNFGFSYAIIDRAGIASAFTEYGVKTNSPLPIVLLKFDVIKHKNIAEILWATSSEVNNKGFEIQKSFNGKDWNSVQFVESKAYLGNSSIQLSYQYSDNNPAKGVNIYRLKQIDRDGMMQYSPMKTVTFDGLTNIEIYPNPVNQNFVINGLEESDNVKIFDVMGTLLIDCKKYKSGELISMDRFRSGVYNVVIERQSGEVKKFKLIKL